MGRMRDWAKCVDCGSRRQVKHKEWIRASQPRCYACGGRVEPSDDAKDEHAEHHDASRENRSLIEQKQQIKRANK